jgi:hypothetical protein
MNMRTVGSGAREAQLWQSTWLRAAVVGLGFGFVAVLAWYLITPGITESSSKVHVPSGRDLALHVPGTVWLTPPIYAICAGLIGWATERFTATLSPATRSETLSVVSVVGCTLGGAAILGTVWLIPHKAVLVSGDGRLPDIGFGWAYAFPVAGFALGVMIAGGIRHPDEDD